MSVDRLDCWTKDLYPVVSCHEDTNGEFVPNEGDSSGQMLANALGCVGVSLKQIFGREPISEKTAEVIALLLEALDETYPDDGVQILSADELLEVDRRYWGLEPPKEEE